jgi:hypothetical protein
MTLKLLVQGRQVPQYGHGGLTRYAGTVRPEECTAYTMDDAERDAVLEGAELLPGITRPSGLFVPRPKSQRLVIYRDTLQSLVNKGEIGKLQEDAGCEIRDVYQLLMGGSSHGVGSYTEEVALPNGEMVPARYGAAVTRRFLPWQAWARRTPINRAKTKTAYDVAILICGWGLGKRQAANALSMDQDDVLKRLQLSLWRYAEMAGWVEVGEGLASQPTEAA